MVTESISNAKWSIRIYYNYNTKFLLSEQDTAGNRQNSHAICSKNMENLQ